MLMVEISKSWLIRKLVIGYKHFLWGFRICAWFGQIRSFYRSNRRQTGFLAVKNRKFSKDRWIMAFYPLLDRIFWEDFESVLDLVKFGHFTGQIDVKRVIIGVKMTSSLIYYRICMTCIWIDWKFSSEFTGVNLEVIRGHPRGQKWSFWGQKSKIWPNAHDMHMIRFQILFWF